MKRVVAIGGAVLAMGLFGWRGHAIAPAGRYDTSTAGIVLDTKTRLAWQQSLQAGLNLQAAKNHCLSIAGGTWRLPSVHELMTLIDDTTSNPIKIDEVAFPGVTMSSANTWTLTPVSGDPSRVWSVNFYFAKITEAGISATTPRTRCVRFTP